MDVLKRIAALVAPYRRSIAWALFLQLIVIFSRLIAPFLTRAVVNDVIPTKNLSLLVPLCGGLIGLALLRAAGTYRRGLLLEEMSQSVVYDLRTGLYRHMQELPHAFYDEHRIGDIMSRMTSDIEGVRNLLGSGIITVFMNVLNFFGALTFLAFMNWKLMLSLLTFAPLIALAAFHFNKRIRPAFRSIREQNAVLNTRTQENLAGMRVVKAFAREPYEAKQFEKDNRELLRLHLAATWIWSDFVPLMELMSGLCMPVMLVVGGYMVLNGHMDIGTLVAANGYVWLITEPMRMLSNIINMVAQAITSAEKLFYYMDIGSSIREAPDAESPKTFQGGVVFDHVTFSYGGEDVLKDVSFEAKPGETVAIMGATGSGKTTLMLLLGRFYDVKSGSVRIDGIDVKKHKMKPLRREIGYVMQETFLFSDTLEDNVRFGRPAADMTAVREATDAAEATEFIEATPQKFDTIVGERGVGLSGGQKQRTAIARAILIKPSILVLDDSTSAVDMETEYLIQRNMKKVLKDQTTFIIAHRISSVKNADQILVLEDGRVAERGTHAELMHKKGFYFQMFLAQYKDYESIVGSMEGSEA